MAVYQVDHAFFVYRYASNLARGEGFVFNPGERAEGVTCFLWTLLLAAWAVAALRLPIVPPVLTAAAGCAIVLVLPFVSARLAGRLRPDPLDGAAAALLAAHPAAGGIGGSA